MLLLLASDDAPTAPVSVAPEAAAAAFALFNVVNRERSLSIAALSLGSRRRRSRKRQMMEMCVTKDDRRRSRYRCCDGLCSLMLVFDGVLCCR